MISTNKKNQVISTGWAAMISINKRRSSTSVPLTPKRRQRLLSIERQGPLHRLRAKSGRVARSVNYESTGAAEQTASRAVSQP
jgi:hypothetical protein